MTSPSCTPYHPSGCQSPRNRGNFTTEEDTDGRCTTREAFCQATQRIAAHFATELWTTVVETSHADAETDKALAWRTTQLDRLATARVENVIDGLRVLGGHQRRVTKRAAVNDLARYLTTNRERMRYQRFRAAGYAIGSGAVESAVSHVVQQRMKRVGMRWRAKGADVMLALRSIYRTTGAWDRFWATRRAA